METQPDGSMVMRPVKVVPVTLAVQESQAARDWAQTHTAEIDQYNAWAAQPQQPSRRAPKKAALSDYQLLLNQ
jgi:hypothetical protein